jgi:P2 family phage contractile tail tube protein
MPKKVYNNVEDHRLIDNNRVVEDVTSVNLPTVEHPTVDIDAAGMAGVVSMPNSVKVNAMEFTVNHNNGENCARLADSGKHTIELRVVRQRYTVAKGEIEHEPVKYRITGVHKSTEDGTVEAGNPLGSSDKYSVLRYEKIMNGITVTLIDVMTGTIKINGKDITNVVQNMLN